MTRVAVFNLFNNKIAFKSEIKSFKSCQGVCGPSVLKFSHLLPNWPSSFLSQYDFMTFNLGACDQPHNRNYRRKARTLQISYINYQKYYIGWSRTEQKSCFPMSLTSSSSSRDRNKYGGIWFMRQAKRRTRL